MRPVLHECVLRLIVSSLKKYRLEIFTENILTQSWVS